MSGFDSVKRNVLSRVRKVARDGADLTSGGRQFHTWGPATENVRLPTVERWTGGWTKETEIETVGRKYLAGRVWICVGFPRWWRWWIPAAWCRRAVRRCGRRRGYDPSTPGSPCVIVPRREQSSTPVSQNRLKPPPYKTNSRSKTWTRD